jgi:acetylornithine/succinyldiaminopimelate/putrescine aminotransferase
MNIPTVEFIQALRKLCDQRGVLLVCDEVWTAPGRTGKWFAHQNYGITPDVMTLAKAIGGGLPVAACVASPKYADILGPGTHGCTMGGNPLCTAAGAAAMKLIEDEDLTGRARTLGNVVMAKLESAQLPHLIELRGKGLMIGLQLEDAKPVKDIWDKCMTRGLIICIAKNNVLRLAPPLTISEENLQAGLDILIDVMRS